MPSPELAKKIVEAKISNLNAERVNTKAVGDTKRQLGQDASGEDAKLVRIENDLRKLEEELAKLP